MKEYEIGLYEKAIRNSLSWKEKLLCAKECGYDYLELCVDASDERIARIYMSREERFELLELMYETKLPIRSMSVSALTKYALGDPDKRFVRREWRSLRALFTWLRIWASAQL